MVDSSIPLDDNDSRIIDKIQDKKCVCLFNKSDLETVVNEEDISNKIDGRIISFSAKDSIGLDELEEEIKNLFFDGKISSNDETIITNVRHKDLLCKCKESLSLVEQSINNDMPEDFYSIDLMDAYKSLGTIIGESVEDDLVEEIFSKFCMGK